MEGSAPPLFPVAAAGQPAARGALFPVLNQKVASQALVGSPSPASTWLANSSFAPHLVPPPAAIPQVYAAAQLLDSSEDEEPVEGDAGASSLEEEPHTGDSAHEQGTSRGHDTASKPAVGSASAEEQRKRDKRVGHRKARKHRKDDESSDKRREKRHHKRRKRAEREKERAQAESASLDQLRVPAGTERKAAVTNWVDEAAPTQEYYFDSRGDRDNLAFGSLYRLDVARYHRQLSGWPDHLGAKRGTRGGLHEPEEDASRAVAGEARYWGPGHAAKEKSKKLKRVKARLSGTTLAPPGEFLPLSEPAPPGAHADGSALVEGESVEEALLRRTRELNERTRARPQEVQGWLDFAAFQDELLHKSSKREARPVLDKKLAILEKALEHHPESDVLVLAYLRACAQRDDAPQLLAKWATVLQRLPGSGLLWREYLRLRKGQYATFTVSDVRAAYAQAIAALGQERNRSNKEGVAKDKVLQLEREMVLLFLDACLFERQAGHHELATGLLQAAAEYAVFAPQVQASDASKQLLFRHFWQAGAPRFGEQGAQGWGTWLAQEEARLQDGTTEVAEEEGGVEEQGGWTGWQDLRAIGSRERGSDEERGGTESDGDRDEEGDEVQEETDEALLARLGINLDAADATDAASPATWHRWAQEEDTRDAQQWRPVRPPEDDDSAEEASDAEGELQRTVLFEDVQPFLFSLHNEVAGQELLAGLAELCDAPLPPWCASNTALLTEARDCVTGSLREQLVTATTEEQQPTTHFPSAADAVPGSVQEQGMVAVRGGNKLVTLAGGSAWLEDDPPHRQQFASTLLLQAAGAYPAFSPLMQALFQVTSSLDASKAQARTLAKALLKQRRSDLLLWGAYAELEAGAGNVTLAHKVLATTLSSLPTLPVAAQEQAAQLVLTCVEMELRGGADGRQAALNVLACFGAGDAVTLGGAEAVPPSRILKAQNGFRDKLQVIRTATKRRALSEADVATVACAAHFSELCGGGWRAAAAVFEDALTWGLPDQRARSAQYEALTQRYVQLLECSPATPAAQRQAVLRGLATFPHNPQLLSALVRGEAHRALANRLRRYFDAAAVKAPSAVVCLFALACELGRPKAGARIRSLFERAVSHPETSQSIMLWRAYLAFELDAPEAGSLAPGRPDAARRVFFRALHACPWSKRLWLEGFKRLGPHGALTGKELADLCETMREKEIRVRTDIYEVLLQEVEAERT